MPKTHLPAHMDSVRQKCRPKHQLLILKCYPRLPKNSAADVKPNGSELSYLLYYASTRSSKLNKVGAFLEKKTVSDISHYQSARVLVTLQIVSALVEKLASIGSALALIAPYVLRIIRDILTNTNDISLIDATQATWDVFCDHHDHALFAADSEYRELFEHIVSLYAAFACNDGPKKLGKSAQPVPTHDAIHLRQAGLGALRSLLQSSTLAFESGRQLLNFTVPAILGNLHGDDAAYLEYLLRVSKNHQDEEKDKAMNRRQSMATVRTFTRATETSVDADPRAVAGTTQDADELEEEEVAILALDCLKSVFDTDNRTQVRLATSAMLTYLNDTQHRLPHSPTLQSDSAPDSWATKILEISTAWTPVQGRFILLVTAVETLVRIPLKESDLRQHLLYTSLIDHILRSDLNLIGLSVMDVLLGLIQQTLHVLQLSTPPMADSSMAVPADSELNRVISAGSGKQLSEARLRLVVRLKNCIANLATHVYYTDQISDMISAILLRLKPSPSPAGEPNALATAAAIEQPNAAVREVASNVSLHGRERSYSATSGYFSFEVARQIALEAVKDIVVVANSRSFSGGGVAESRSPIPISIWEGTQWLLRDPAAAVRRSYIEALTTWLELETKKSDFRMSEPRPKAKKTQDGVNGTLARRAVSNASAKDRQSKRATSSFLQLLHLACYENALQYAATSESDILKLNLLLATLIRKLGVNALQSGLPMMSTLQEDIARIAPPIAKVRIGSLVHVYFWTIVEVFDFPTDAVGQEIFAEIQRRRQHKLWTKDLHYPPMPLDKIPSFVGTMKMESEFIATEELKPFDRRQQLVDRVVEAYEVKVTSPPPSAPGSPGRHFTLPRSPTVERASSHLNALHDSRPLAVGGGSSFFADRSLLNTMKERMLASWSREECLAAVAASAPKSVSLSASRSSPTQALAAGNHRQLLASANNAPPGRDGGAPNLSRVANPNTQSRHRQQAFGPISGRVQSQSPDGRPSGSTNGKGSSSAGVKGPLRIDELKRILANGGAIGIVGRHDAAADDTASDSMVDVEEDGDVYSDSGEYHTPRGNSTAGSANRKEQEAHAGEGAAPTHPSRPAAVRESKKSSRRDVAALLEGISLGPDTSRVVQMEEPPY